MSVEDQLVERIRRRNTPVWRTVLSVLVSRKALIPAVAIASLILVLFTVFRTPGVSGPSAIVTSLSGDTASVIIMETPDTGHTILWFSEES